MYRHLLYYIPSKAVPFDGFQSILVKACVSHAADWNLPSELVAAMQAKKTEWDAAYEITANRKTASPAATAARNALLGDYRELLEKVIHDHIVGNDAVSEGDKTALGIHRRKATHTQAPPPTTIPLLKLEVNDVCAHRIHFHDSATPQTRGRADTATYCELWYLIDGAPPKDPAEAGLRCNITRSGQRVTFGVADKGKTVHYFARWVNRKGEQGPWSPVVSAPVM